VNWQRLLRHAFSSRHTAGSAFSDAVRDAIEAAIGSSESQHLGEIRFAIEGALHPLEIWRGVTPAARARRVFAELDVWDTALNNGVLIYVLVADRAVEIVADRGFAGRVDAAEWSAACRSMETEFSQGRHREGAIAGVAAVGAIIARHFPPGERNPNELADRPVVL
jgi:uncharacterized membrane protein